VPHHGSRDAGLPVLLGRLRPQVAGIEWGRAQLRPPDASETRRAAGRPRSNLWTDRYGTVAVKVGAEGMRVETER
jgi:beta-lactamase superfamily II metal-dependent hydrolase